MVEGGLPIFDDIRGLAAGLPMWVVIVVVGLVVSGLLKLRASSAALAVQAAMASAGGRDGAATPDLDQPADGGGVTAAPSAMPGTMTGTSSRNATANTPRTMTSVLAVSRTLSRSVWLPVVGGW